LGHVALYVSDRDAAAGFLTSRLGFHVVDYTDRYTLILWHRLGSALGRLDMLDAIAHTLHVILAGAWLGGVVFTTTVVSPALKSMGWDEAEQARVRSVIGRQYAKVGTANLVLLLVFALLEGALSGFGPALYSEYALLALLFGLVASQGVYFGRRLVELAEARKATGDSEKAQMLALRRRRLQRLSFGISMLNILISAAVMILATYARTG
jgi:uncharacterized membrane protein